MYKKIKQEVFQANIELIKRNLVVLTWGNVSARINENLIAIKPSGVEYNSMTPDDIVIVNLEGKIIEGNYKPSSDTPTHIELYKKYPQIKGVCHTHSTFATAFAQAGISIPALGTTHADYFYGDIPCCSNLTREEVMQNYEINTGKIIIETFKNKDIESIPACIIKSHGVFSWGNSAKTAVEHAFIVEEIAKINYYTLTLNKKANLSSYILDKHYKRKHGKNAYYGQIIKK